MKYLTLLLVLSCAPSSKEKAKRYVSKDADCIHEHDRGVDLVFCVDGNEFIVCGHEGCLVYEPRH